MGGIGRRQKRALVVIQTPRDIRRTGIFEVDDRILVAVKIFLVEERTRPVQQAGIDEFAIAADAFAVEARKQRSRTRAVETLVVIEDPNSQVCSFLTRARAQGENQ